MIKASSKLQAFVWRASLATEENMAEHFNEADVQIQQIHPLSLTKH